MSIELEGPRLIIKGIAKRLNFDHIIYISYSIDFRRKVISTREEEGLSIRKTAKQFWISSSSVSRWINQIEPKASTTHQRKIDKSELMKDIEQYTDFYQKERAERFGVCQKAIWQALKKMGLTYRKRYIIQKPRKALGKRFNKKNNSMKKKVSPLFLLMKVVFTRYHTDSRLFPKGQRCFGLKNWRAKGRTNIIVALLGITLFAIGLFNININSDIFYAWVTQFLIPVLPKNSVIMMDNATFHKK